MNFHPTTTPPRRLGMPGGLPTGSSIRYGFPRDPCPGRETTPHSQRLQDRWLVHSNLNPPHPEPSGRRVMWKMNRSFVDDESMRMTQPTSFSGSPHRMVASHLRRAKAEARSGRSTVDRCCRFSSQNEQKALALALPTFGSQTFSGQDATRSK